MGEPGGESALAGQEGAARVARPQKVRLYDLSNLHMICRLGEQLFAMPARQVREVTEYRRPVPVPRAPDFVAGIVNHHGRTHVLVELGRLLQMSLGPRQPSHLVLLARDDVALGFSCDGVLRIAPLNVSVSDPVVMTEDGPVMVLDLDDALTGLETYFG